MQNEWHSVEDVEEAQADAPALRRYGAAIQQSFQDFRLA